MKSRVRAKHIHFPVIIDGIPDGQGHMICQEEPLRIIDGHYSSKDIVEVTCPYCKYRWFKTNKHRLTNLPKQGSVLVHWTTELVDGEWRSVCGPVDVNNYHVCSSKDQRDVNCYKCLQNIAEDDINDVFSN